MQTQEATEKAGRRGRKTGDDAHIACPFSIIADTREQLDYQFSGLRADAKYGRRLIGTTIVHRCLKPGDYSILGLEHVVRVERKSKEDLFGTIGQRRQTFDKRLKEMNGFPIARVVVEAVWMEMVCYPPLHSSLQLKNIFRTISAWQIAYPMVHWWFCPTRRFAEEATFRTLWRAWELSKREMPRH